MTEEQAAKFDSMIKQTQEVHDFWFKPPILDQPSRAIQFDRMLSISKGAKFTSRVFMYTLGAGMAILGAVQTVKAFIDKFGGS